MEKPTISICPECARIIVPGQEHACSGRFPWANAKPEVPQFGPGTELHKLLHQLGFSIGGCSCQKWINKMNVWGVDGCREHRAEIIAHLETMKDAASLTEKLKAGALAIKGGLPLSVPALVDLAIAAAEHQ